MPGPQVMTVDLKPAGTTSPAQPPSLPQGAPTRAGTQPASLFLRPRSSDARFVEHCAVGSESHNHASTADGVLDQFMRPSDIRQRNSFRDLEA